MGAAPEQRRKLSWWQETFLLLGLALLTSIVVKTLLLQMFFVPSASMRPQLIEDDRILVEKISMWDGEVARGDVVVFRDPGGWLGATPDPTGVQALLSVAGLYPDGGHLVKRAVAVGGDEVACCDTEGRMTVNGQPLTETYLAEGTAPSERQFEAVIPDDHVWVLGDNRTNSQDSRFHLDDLGQGAVPLDNVVGKVWAIVWPGDRMNIVDRPETYDEIDVGG